MHGESGDQVNGERKTGVVRRSEGFHWKNKFVSWVVLVKIGVTEPHSKVTWRVKVENIVGSESRMKRV